jgi:hypothetical protein
MCYPAFQIRGFQQPVGDYLVGLQPNSGVIEPSTYLHKQLDTT